MISPLNLGDYNQNIIFCFWDAYKGKPVPLDQSIGRFVFRYIQWETTADGGS